MSEVYTTSLIQFLDFTSVDGKPVTIRIAAITAIEERPDGRTLIHVGAATCRVNSPYAAVRDAVISNTRTPSVPVG